MSDTAKRLPTPPGVLSSSKTRSSTRRRTRLTLALPVPERAPPKQPLPPDARKFTTLRAFTDDAVSFWTLQSYLESLYTFPTHFELRVIEKPATVTPIETPQRGDRPPDDYYINFGRAIETIKDDFPNLFVRDFDYSIFREDLVFRDPINSFQGLRFYKYMLLSLSFWPREEGKIRVRWSIHAIPRIPWEAESIFDGVSEYKLDRHGKIYEHAVDNIIFRDPPVFRLPVLFAELSPTSRQQNPIPSAWCRSEGNEGCYFMHRFSWVRLYFILSVVQSMLKTCEHTTPKADV